MKYRKIGRSKLQVSEIGMGTMSLGSDQKENEAIITTAFDAGINFFDTADIYEKGRNEKSVGKAIKSFRKKIVLSTKVGNQWHKDGSSLIWNPGKKYILKSVESSLKRLGTDYIDLYQLHGGTTKDPIEETIEAFEELKKAGKIRNYGISSIRPNVIREYIKHSKIDSVMMQYSLLDRRPEEECLGEIRAAGFSILARGVLGRGLLIDKPAGEYLGYSDTEVEKLRISNIGTTNPIGNAIGFVLRLPVVSSAVIGVRTLDQCKDLINSYEKGWTDTEKLSLVLKPNLYELHR